MPTNMTGATASAAARGDAGAPGIFVGETAPRPTGHPDPPPPPRPRHPRGIAVRVRDRRLLADPYPFVDAAAEMLGELAEYGGLDPRPGVGGIDGDRDVGRRRRALGGGRQAEGKSGRERRKDEFRTHHDFSP